MEKVPLCPLRKSTTDAGTLPNSRKDMFLPCLQANCAWFGADKKCAVAKIADSIGFIEKHGMTTYPMPV
jgi:hypothetical protein